MKYGDVLKKLRNNKNLSQKELTDRLNINRSTYARYETSSTQPDYDTLEKLADFYDVTIDYLLGRTNNNIHFDPMTEINNLLKKYDIDQSGFFDIEKWKAMGPDEIKQLEDYFEFITSRAKERNKEDKKNE